MSPSLGSSITLYASPQKPGVLFGLILAGQPWFEWLSVIKGGTLESKSMICSLAGLIDQGHDEDA